MSRLAELNSKINDRTWLVALSAMVLLLRCPVFVYPFLNGDEATYSAMANALLNGNLLYSSVVDHKPPLIYLTYGLILSLTGSYNVAAVRLVSIIAVLVTALVLSRIAKSAGRSVHEERVAALCYVIFSAMGPGKDMLAANAEIFMALPTVVAVRLYLHHGSPLWRIAVGLCCSLAFLYKYQGGAVLGGLTFALLLDKDTPWTMKFRQLCCLGIGFALPVIGLCVFYRLHGDLASLYFWGWSFPKTYAGLLTWKQIVFNGLTMSAKWGLPNLVLIAAAISGMTLLKREHTAAAYGRILLFWLFWSILAVASGGRFTLHYYLQLLPPLSLAAAAGLTHGMGMIRVRISNGGKQLVVPARLSVLLVFLPLAIFWSSSLLDHRVRPHVMEYTKIYKEVGAWVKANSDQEDRIFVWGNSPEIYYFSRRIMGTRFVFCNYQSGKIWGTPYDLEGAEGTEALAVAPTWDMLLSDISTRRPRWIIDAAAAGLDRWRGHELPRYPPLWQLISTFYQQVGEVRGAAIYRLRDQ